MMSQTVMQTPINFPNFPKPILYHFQTQNSSQSHLFVDEETRKSRSRSRSAERDLSLSQLREQALTSKKLDKDLDRGKQPRNMALENGNGVFRQKYSRKFSYGLDNDVDFMFVDTPKSSMLDQVKPRDYYSEKFSQRGLDRIQNTKIMERLSTRGSDSDLFRGLPSRLKSTMESELSESGRFYQQKEVVCIEDEEDTCDWTQENGTGLSDNSPNNVLFNIGRRNNAIVIDDDEESEEEVDRMKIVIESYEDNYEDATEEKPRGIPLQDGMSKYDERHDKMVCYLEEKGNIRDPRRQFLESSLPGTGAGSTPEKCIVLDDE